MGNQGSSSNYNHLKESCFESRQCRTYSSQTHHQSPFVMEALSEWNLAAIFSHLSLADRLSAELVCRQWNRLAKDRRSWRNFRVLKNSDLQVIADSKPIKASKMNALLSRFKRHIREIHFVSLDFTEQNGRRNRRNLYSEHIEMVLLECPNVRHVKIDIYAGPEHLLGLQKCLSSIHLAYDPQYADELILHGSFFVTYVRWLMLLFQAQPSLEYLVLDYFPDEIRTTALANLKFPASLKHISFGPYISRGNLQLLTVMVAQQCPALVSLERPYCELEELSALKLKKLQYLKEYCFCAVEKRHSFLRFGHWENLRALNFHWMDNKLLQTVARNCPHIEHLGIVQCWGTVETKFVLRNGLWPALSSVALSDYTAINMFLPLLGKGTLQYIYLNFGLCFEIDELWALIVANPELKELHLDQLIFPQQIDALGELYSSWQANAAGLDLQPEHPAELHIVCRGYDSNCQYANSLTKLIPWIHVDKRSYESCDKAAMPVLDQIRFNQLTEPPYEF